MRMGALCLVTAENVREALADYTQMPFTYKGRARSGAQSRSPRGTPTLPA
ncbi:hypothetical protein [Sorangium sp. So ce341]